jgi:hypothetical protein
MVPSGAYFTSYREIQNIRIDVDPREGSTADREVPHGAFDRSAVYFVPSQVH